MAIKPFVRGKDAKLRFFQNASERVFPCKTWEIGRDATKSADGVNGEDRDRLDSVTNFFTLSAQVYVEDAALLVAFLEDQENKDAQVSPLDKTAGITLKIQDGSKVAFICEEIEVDDWKLNNGGRADALMVTVPMRFRYFKQVQTM